MRTREVTGRRTQVLREKKICSTEVDSRDTGSRVVVSTSASGSKSLERIGLLKGTSQEK